MSCVDEFVNEVLEASRGFEWIKRFDVERTDGRAKIRLWLNDDFVEVYYNADKRVVSFAYIRGGRRIFGVNNIRIGWHLHPFGREEEHVPTGEWTIRDFLETLEKEMRKKED